MLAHYAVSLVLLAVLVVWRSAARQVIANIFWHQTRVFVSFRHSLTHLSRPPSGGRD
jgi:hypothetical protein